MRAEVANRARVFKKIVNSLERRVSPAVSAELHKTGKNTKWHSLAKDPDEHVFAILLYNLSNIGIFFAVLELVDYSVPLFFWQRLQIIAYDVIAALARILRSGKQAYLCEVLDVERHG